MRKIIMILALSTAPAFAQTGALNTNDVGLDQLGICWHRGPANTMVQCGVPLSGAALTVTATTVLPKAGNWLVISTTGTPTIVVANGTSTAAGVAGKAYPL